MTNYEKYQDILEMLFVGFPQRQIVERLHCSYSTITSAQKFWLKYHDNLPNLFGNISDFFASYKNTTIPKKTVAKKSSSKKPVLVKFTPQVNNVRALGYINSVVNNTLTSKTKTQYLIDIISTLSGKNKQDVKEFLNS